MRTKLLTAGDLAHIVAEIGRDRFMDLMIERMRGCFVDHDPETVEARSRDGFRYDKPALGLIEWMPTHEVGGPVVIKMVGYHPTNPTQRTLPSVLATSSMWDTETGHLLAVADATLLTAVRTGAASALATDVLAVDRPIVLGVIGLGAQAVTQVHAISRIRPVDRIVGFDLATAVTDSFADRIAFTGLPFEAVSGGDLEAMAASVDVLCTCTSVDIGAGPVVGEFEPNPWLHVNAVGADFPGKLELPTGLLAEATIFPDTLAQCIAEGECQQAPADRIGPEIEAVTKHPERHLVDRNRLTVFDSTGWAVEDDVALRLALEQAERLDLGTDVELESIPVDPFDPYGPTRGGG